jgi:hypothetical protein
MQSSVYFRPPSPPFRRTALHPNLLYSVFWTDVPVSEKNILQTIATMIKRYEPRFKLEGAFTSGVCGRADPQYSATRAERFRRLAVKNGLSDEPKILGRISFAEAMADVMDGHSADGAEADPRINWRVTARHGDYYIHIMALDQGLSRFACCLQTSAEFDEGLGSEHRSQHTRYKAGNLAEIEHILDEIYANFKRQDEQRRDQDEQRREQDRIDAIVKERKVRQERLTSAERRRRKLICILVCIIVVFLIAYASSQGWISVETGFTLIILTIILVVGWYDFNEKQKKNREYSRAIDEQNERKAEADERRRVYEENYQREGRALKKRVLEDLKAIARREKVRLDPAALDAVKALQMRQGEHPETVAAWAPLLADLSAEIIDATAIHNRLDDLLYPETLEDVEVLKKLVVEDLERLEQGEPLTPEGLAASKALQEIRARDARKKREEREAEALERRLEKEADKRFSAAMEEMARDATRNILRMHGLPDTALEGLSPH